MMKVIKAIVDEIPKACINCGYGYLKNSPYCTLSQCKGIDVNPYISRPDWCPLVRKDLYDMEIIQNFVGKESEE
jgi:hypothetical protein